MSVRALTESGKDVRGAITLDGRYVAYVKRDAGMEELHLLQVATGRDVQLLPGSPLGVVNLHFSPDGNFVYFLRQLKSEDPDAAGVYRIATLGGPATPLATDATMHSVTVSPDGKQIAYIAHSAKESFVVSIDFEGGNRQIVARRPLEFQFWFVEWSHSMKTLAEVASGKDDMGLVSIDTPSGTIRDLTVTGWGAIGQPAWSADNREIYLPGIEAGGALFQIWAIDAQTGDHKPITSNSTNYLQWSLSATGAGDLLADTNMPAFTLWTTDHSRQMHQIPSLRSEGQDSVIWVENRIVSSNIIDMILHDADGKNPTKLRSYSVVHRHLARCGPAQVVYWANDRTRLTHVARTDITTGSSTALTEGPLDGEPTCTLDGSTLIYDRGPNNHNFLIRKSLQSGQQVVLHEFEQSEPDSARISPDGMNVLFRIVYDSGDAPDWETIPTTGGNLKKLKLPVAPGEVADFRWAPDGKSILYAKNENGVGNIWSAPLDGGQPKRLTGFQSDRIFSFDVSPDNRLVVARGDYLRDLVLLESVR